MKGVKSDVLQNLNHFSLDTSNDKMRRNLIINIFIFNVNVLIDNINVGKFVVYSNSSETDLYLHTTSYHTQYYAELLHFKIL